jgi:DeoR/GlpR family transcriptional regulator of sugar metabolism
VDTGITDYDWEVAMVKKAILKVASRSAVLSISEKLGTEQKVQVCKLSTIDYLVTELQPQDNRLESYRQFCKVI